MPLALPIVLASTLAAAQPAPAGGGVGTGVGSERRAFDVRSADAWAVVQRRLKELGLGVDQLDRENQALRTKWRRFPSGDPPWLTAPRLPSPYAAERVRFVVFVSPFVEPARISVGSQVEATRLGPASTAFVYNVVEANRALMAEIATALEAAALPRYERDGPDPCPASAPRSPSAKITPPRKIAVSELDVVYPGPDVRNRESGDVKLEIQVLEDGSVGDIRVVGPPVGEQLAAAATGAASLLLYSPVRLDGCPARFVMTYTVRFRLR